MYKYTIILLCCLTSWQAIGQQPLTSRDIRHALGKGPYPVYVNFLGVSSGMQSTFKSFIDDFISRRKLSYPTLKERHTMVGVEGNLGIVINTDHFLGITNFRINRISLELGYRYLHRDLGDKEGQKPLHLQEDAASIRLGIRGNILYPITYQLQAGPMIYHHTQVKEPLQSVVDLRTGIFPAGWDLRARLMLFDPAGTAGGLGGFIECRYLITSQGRDINPFYEEILGEFRSNLPPIRWNYVSWSIGLVVPLALRWI